jgi:hypothetical protein
VNNSDGDLLYVLDEFLENGIDIEASGSEDGANYIVAVRTSSLWHSGMTMGVSVNFAYMENPFGPTGEDTYPNNNWEDPVSEDVGYSSSFTVWDYSSGPRYAPSHLFENAWNHPYNTYTPLTEHARPRWDLPAQTFEVVFGEALGFRRIFPIETWIPLLGINVHSTATQHEIDPLRPEDPDFFFNGNAEEGSPMLREVNVILKDIGGEAGALAGSGGFDPRKHLDPVTAAGYYGSEGDGGGQNNAIGLDYTYNGIWVFYDTNNNGIFDPPVPGESGGAALTDHPLFPDIFTLSDVGTPELVDWYKERWQFVGNPPDGGDPWWRIKLRFYEGRRRERTSTTPTGYIEAVPDNFGPGKGASEISPDFFVVMRPDSGFQDASLVPGDGTGYLVGADLKANIEPRWFDPVQGHYQGGIHVNTQIPGVGQIVRDQVVTAWQDDPRWYTDEPWWPERTSNPNTTKPVRNGIEIHDYTLLYESNSRFTTDTSDIWYPRFFLNYMDPLGSIRDHFYYGYSFDFPSSPDAPTVRTWHVDSIAGSYQGVPVISDGWTQFSFPFETAPFYQGTMDENVAGPRSPVYFGSMVKPQPTLPTYGTWPMTLPPGRYPSYYDWEPQHRRARLLKQHIEINSLPTPMLGINLVGADDPVVNRVNARVLNEIYVAFWGPNFSPSDLKPLLANGQGSGDSASGVQLRYDADSNGTYSNPVGFVGITADSDPPLELKDLAWPANPEHVDLDGDGVSDDLTGDGVVTAADVAWVLRLIPKVTPYLPKTDLPLGNSTGGGDTGGDTGGGDDDEDDSIFGKSGKTSALLGATAKGSVLINLAQPGALDAAYSEITAKPLEGALAGIQAEVTLDAKADQAAPAPKAVPLLNNAGDDLFITVRTSASLGRFENFRAFIPATLPDRPRTARQAGIKITPSVQISPQALTKSSPAVGPVQDCYFHDMLEANVPVLLHPLGGANQTIARRSDAFAVMGIDISTNRGAAAGVAAQGANGTGAQGTFTVNAAGWTPNAMAGYFLIDRSFRAFEISANTDSLLTLVSTSTPTNGKWFIAKDPTFLEQIIVEFYDEGGDGGFSILDDLLPLNREDLRNSGVAIYRDNDNDPANENGKFDSTDIPVPLDADPQLIGESGEVTTQVKFVFSSPGTDDVPVPKVQQEPLRQWVPDTFANGLTSDPSFGDDFFVVIRTSEEISVGDDFTVGVVSWGPDTPTQPDADTFVRDNVPEIHKDGLAQFLEFPWGSRALGFITYFKTPPDNSGFNWIRSTVAQYARGPVIKASSQVGGGGSDPGGGTSQTTITSVTPSVISTTIPDTGQDVVITGTGFGTSPVLKIASQTETIEIITSSNTEIVARILGGTVFTEGSLAVFVQNAQTLTSATRTDLLSAISGAVPPSPIIQKITPEVGSQADFPVTITGTGFVDPEVYFGRTKMPVAYVNPEGTRIDVNFPSPQSLQTGALDVQVKSNHVVDGEKVVLAAMVPDGFYFRNTPAAPVSPCFIATAAYGTPMGKHLDTFRAFRDGVLLQTAPGTAFVDLYYSVSPSVAKVVAVHPWLAALVRIVLTPAAWLIEQPAGLILPVAALWLSRRMRRRAVKA